MRVLLPTVAFLAIATATASAEYRRIGEGPSLDYANAYCENASMGVDDGYAVRGDPAFVGMYALGSAIGRAVKQSKFHENCMVMQGWKWFPDPRPSRAGRSIRARPRGRGPAAVSSGDPRRGTLTADWRLACSRAASNETA